MKIMIDTDIIISAALNPSGRAAEAFIKALHKPFEPAVSNYILDELHRRFQEKFPARIMELEAFLYHMLRAVIILPTLGATIYDDERVQGHNMHVFRAAINATAGYILTGDKDFLTSGIKFPHIVSSDDFSSL